MYLFSSDGMTIDLTDFLGNFDCSLLLSCLEDCHVQYIQSLAVHTFSFFFFFNLKRNLSNDPFSCCIPKKTEIGNMCNFIFPPSFLLDFEIYFRINENAPTPVHRLRLLLLHFLVFWDLIDSGIGKQNITKAGASGGVRDVAVSFTNTHQNETAVF